MLLGASGGRWQGDRVTGTSLWRKIIPWLRNRPVNTIWDAAFPRRTGEQMVILGSPTKRVDLSWCEWMGCLGKDRGPCPWNRAGSGWETFPRGTRRSAGEQEAVIPLFPPTMGAVFGQILRPRVLLNLKEMARGQDKEPDQLCLFQWLYYT